MKEPSEVATVLDPIYNGITHNLEYYNATRHRDSVLKYNSDTRKILDKCWKCSHFGIGAENRCKRCRATLLKAIEIQEQMKK